PHIRWDTANFHVSAVPPIPDPGNLNTGPLTMDVTLVELGVTVATPFDTTLRTAEAYFHDRLGHDLPLIFSSLFSNLMVFEDPGSTDLLVTDGAGRQTRRRSDSSLVPAIPFSISDPASPLAPLFAP